MTVIMLIYKRLANARRILEALRDQTIKPTVWLWNNSGQPLSDSRADLEVAADVNLYCWPRWFLASYAKTTHVMLIDDDIVPTSNKLIEIAIDALDTQQEPETIVGAEGVILGPHEGYWPTYSGPIAQEMVGATGRTVHLKHVLADVRVDIVKGRCLALRAQALKALPLSPAHRDLCDDIAVSALLSKGRRRMHLVSSALGRALVDIPDTNPEVALSGQSNWRTIRESARGHYYSKKDVGGEEP